MPTVPFNDFDTSSEASCRELILIDSISLEAKGDRGAAAELLRGKWKTSEGIESAEGLLPGHGLHQSRRYRLLHANIAGIITLS